MKFQLDENMNYNPYHIISKKRLQSKFSTYENQEDSELERTSNKYSWEQVKDILINCRNMRKKQFFLPLLYQLH